MDVARVACRRSLDQLDERLSFFDDVRGELGPVAAADVLRRVDRSGRDEQDVAGLERDRRLALDLVLQRAFDDIDDLFARMPVLGKRHSRVEVDAHLDDLAAGDAEIVPLEVGAFDSRLLRRRYVQHQTAGDDHRRYRHDSSRFHVDSPDANCKTLTAPAKVPNVLDMISSLGVSRAESTGSLHRRWLRNGLAERERKGLHARTEKLDLELALGDGFR